MAITTRKQRKKRSAKLIMIALGIATLGVIILFFSFQRKNQINIDIELPIISSEATREASQEIINSVSIPKDFFENNVLKDFNSYSVIQTPSEWGRENPFTAIQAVPVE